MDREYLCIDLKSFYASVECVERGLDPMTTDLVVADASRTDKTICLAVSPSLKAKGVRNRCRVFEIPRHLDYIMAPPRMKHYIDASANIYAIYLKYIGKNDIHVYSIDEAFMDVTHYLDYYQCTTRELGERIRRDILETTGIPATCGMGPNLYLAKVALDITAKHSPDFFGELDEESYRATLWDHKPLTDFWRVGPGTERRLNELGIRTMGELALYPDQELLYQTFGIDAEILIDHAWGIEPVTIADIKAYRPQTHSLGNAQVLGCAYSFDDALIVAKEMTDQICLELVEKGLDAESITLSVGYDKVGNPLAPHAHGTAHLPGRTNSRAAILEAMSTLFVRIVDPSIPVKRLWVVANNTQPEGEGQLSLFSPAAESPEQAVEERTRQQAILDIKRKFGKNALLKGIDLMPQATQRERNAQIGGHKSGEPL